MSTVAVIGAGATKACGGPATADILPTAFRLAAEGNAAMQREDFIGAIQQFLGSNFRMMPHPGMGANDYPALPLMLGLLDMAIDRAQPLGGMHVDELRRAREGFEYVIFAVLEHSLHTIRNHYDTMVERLWPGDEQPVIISLNYDIIADNTLMARAEQRGLEAFPEYGCDIATPFYRQRARHGRLLKLHGSLNWMYCPTCHRLDLGLSEGGRRTSKMLDALYIEQPHGTDLHSRYSCHGSPCAEGCGGEVRPIMITPTHMKDYRNPHVAQTWYQAERALRTADRVVFVGYSLPDDDIHVAYLLKRALERIDAAAVTVVEWDEEGRALRDHPVGRRYRALFGDGIDWHHEGLAGWLSPPALAV